MASVNNQSLLILIPCFLLVLLQESVPAQEPPIEWGKISRSDFRIAPIPPDSDATALILCDYGESSLNDELGIVFTRITRIKILTAAGFDWGTRRVIILAKDDEQRCKDIEGATFVLDRDSNIIHKDMDSKAVFEEDVDGRHKRYRFTLPSLAPGCIIEFRYTIVAKHLADVEDWTFQLSEPVHWSEYRVRAPAQIAYAVVNIGYEPFFQNEVTHVPQHFSGETSAFLHEELARCNQYRWVVRDAPALREEPFITTVEDYAMKVQLQLSGYASPAGGVVDVLRNWESVVSELLDDGKFGKRIDATGDVSRKAQEVSARLATPEEKVRALYDFVRSSIVWTGSHRLLADAGPDEVLKTKKGSDAEINFLLLSLMKSVGIDGYPVIASTRSNGTVHDVYPIVSQFNCVIAGVKLGESERFLDATDRFRPMEMLPYRLLNVSGLVVQSGPVRWVRLVAREGFIHHTEMKIALSPDGAIHGTAESRDAEYSGLEKRRDIQDGKAQTVAQGIFGLEGAGITVDSVVFTHADNSTSPLKTWATISAEDFAQKAGDLMYVSPVIADRIRKNPFKQQERKYPLDLGYGRDISSVTTLSIPDGYAIKEYPLDREIELSKEAALYSRKTTVNEGNIQISSTLRLKAAELPAASYGRLKDFYQKLVSLQGEQIVLERVKSSK